jgi:RsiW-degrading membrane proteinase PrsW (M82 family)
MVNLKNEVQFFISILLAIFPFGFGFIAATQNFIHYKNFSILIIELMIILVSSFFIFIYREKKPSTFLLITILFIGSIALRVNFTRFNGHKVKVIFDIEPQIQLGISIPMLNEA